jgi:hypothetical protein
VACHWAPVESMTDNFVFGVAVGGLDIGVCAFASGSGVGVCVSVDASGSVVFVSAIVGVIAAGDVEVSPPVVVDVIVGGADPPLAPVGSCGVVGVLVPAGVGCVASAICVIAAGGVVGVLVLAVGDAVGAFGPGSPFTTIVSVFGCSPGVDAGICLVNVNVFVFWLGCFCGFKLAVGCVLRLVAIG